MNAGDLVCDPYILYATGSTGKPAKFWRNGFFHNRKYCLIFLLVVFFVSRILYYAAGVRFDLAPLQSYWQLLDPALFHNDFLRSMLWLKEQPPGYNLLVGLILKVFAPDPALGFSIVSLCLGLVLAVCLFDLMDRLGVFRPLALTLAAISAVSPVTVLYENLLFYEYPLCVLFCVAALFLHRYVSSGKPRDAVVLFSALALIGSIRMIYHLFWYVAIVATLLYAAPRTRKTTMLSASIPGLLLLSIYVKSFLLFGIMSPGSQVYGGMNLLQMIKPNLRPNLVTALADSKTISTVAAEHSFAAQLDAVPLPATTGIPLLDKTFKSTGAVNMESLRMGLVGQQKQKDGFTLLRLYPNAYLKTVRYNLVRCLLPADSGWPFDGRTRTENWESMRGALRAYDLIFLGKIPNRNFYLFHVLAILIIVILAVKTLGAWLIKRSERGKDFALHLTVLFAFINIAYLAAVVILYAPGDQNRYLYETSALMTVLVGVAITRVVWPPLLGVLRAR